MNEHHQVNVIRISEIKTHPNADKLEIIPILGYQAIVSKGQFKLGDLAYYVPPDSVVPEREEYAFLWSAKGEAFPNGVPAKKRRRIKPMFLFSTTAATKLCWNSTSRLTTPQRKLKRCKRTVFGTRLRESPSL